MESNMHTKKEINSWGHNIRAEMILRPFVLCLFWLHRILASSFANGYLGYDKYKTAVYGQTDLVATNSCLGLSHRDTMMPPTPSLVWDFGFLGEVEQKN